MNEMACCAHRIIREVVTENEDKTCSMAHVCDSCGAKFMPIPKAGQSSKNPNERDYTPEEALEEARKRWGVYGRVMFLSDRLEIAHYQVGVLGDGGFEALGSGTSFREAFAEADKQKAQADQKEP